MEKPQSPWAVPEGSAVARLEAEQQTLAELHRSIKEFARNSDITYIIEKDPSRLTVIPEEKDRETLLLNIEKKIEETNAALRERGAQYVLVVQMFKEKIVVESKST